MNLKNKPKNFPLSDDSISNEKIIDTNWARKILLWFLFIFIRAHKYFIKYIKYRKIILFYIFLPEDEQYQLIVSHLYIDMSETIANISNLIESIPICKPNKDNKNRNILTKMIQKKKTKR